ncbi:peptidase A4 family-domain-containing protein [Hyaloscypha finlandica]|nr:peptidase A4 family-domain-containing protein [Hyaloscypha finlandica]
MKFSLAVISILLLATSTLAAPRSKRGLAGRLQRRGRTLQGSAVRLKESKSSKTRFNAATGNTSDVAYSENWSGAAITSPPSGQTFNAVSGKITVPTPYEPSGIGSTDGEYAASAWVGIDGNTYSTAILQTGLDLNVSTSGAVSYDAWSFIVSYTSSSTSATTSGTNGSGTGSGTGKGKGNRGGKGGGHNGDRGNSVAAGAFAFFRRRMILSEQ